MKKIKLCILILWVGLIIPEVFIQPGVGCIKRTDGNQINKKEARDLMYDFYEGDSTCNVSYKFKLLELIGENDDQGCISVDSGIAGSWRRWRGNKR